MRQMAEQVIDGWAFMQLGNDGWTSWMQGPNPSLLLACEKVVRVYNLPAKTLNPKPDEANGRAGH